MSNSSLVSIIGFNIAGAFSGISLAKAGYEVNVYEEHEKEKHSVFCSGLVSREGVEFIKKNFFDPAKALENAIYGAKIFIGNEVLSIKREKPAAYVFNRSMFDELARKRAERMGVEVEYGKRMRINEIKKLRCVVGCDGPFSITAKAFGMGEIKKYVYAQYTYIPEVFESKFVYVFLNKAFPGFFGWVIPRKGYSEVGFGTIERKSTKKAWKFIEKKLNIKPKTIKGSVIPIRPRKTIQTKNAVLVGDAAGLVKSSTGGGIVYAAHCAKALESGISGYSKKIAWLLDEIKIHSAIQSSFEVLSKINYAGLAWLLRKSGALHYLEKEGDSDFPSSFININKIAAFYANLLQ